MHLPRSAGKRVHDLSVAYFWLDEKVERVCYIATTLTRGPFLEKPGNLTGPESDFEIKASSKVGCVLTSNKVHFVSLADNFTVQFSNLLKLPSGMENNTA